MQSGTIGDYMATEYYAEINDKQEGPFAEAELKERIESGKVAADTLVWHEGLDEWKEAGKVRAIAALIAAVKAAKAEAEKRKAEEEARIKAEKEAEQAKADQAEKERMLPEIEKRLGRKVALSEIDKHPRTGAWMLKSEIIAEEDARNAKEKRKSTKKTVIGVVVGIFVVVVLPLFGVRACTSCAVRSAERSQQRAIERLKNLRQEAERLEQLWNR